LTLRHVLMTEVYLRSNRNVEQLDDYFAYFHRTLLQGDDLAPVLLLADRDRGMYQLQDGRKRFAAHLLAGRATILAVVEERDMGGDGSSGG
jgi:hypothetical protein